VLGVAVGVVAGGAAVGLSMASAASVDTTASYVLVNRNSGKALDVYNAATADGARITQWTRSDSAWQQWQFVDSGGGYYRIKSRHSGKVLDINGASTADRATVIQWADRNATNQQFRLADSDGGYVRLIARHSNKTIDVLDFSTADGAQLIQWPDTSGTNQQWQLVRVGATDPSPSVTPSSPTGRTFTNPVVGAPNSADPTLVFHNGFYYYVATTWSANVVMRRSATIAGLRTAAEQVVVRTGGNTMWAPHLELINNRWYLYYSVEQGGLPRRTHVAESAGTDPLGPYTIRGILNLMPNNAWAIDAAPIRLNGTLYMTFSAFGTDGLQSLFIAPMTNPWTAAAFGTRISAPTLAWERQEGAVNEGSFLLQHNGRTFLTYSASQCGGPNYKIGMLEYRGGDPLAAGSWTKFANPIFQRNDANGVYGPGHHSFFTSPDGTETWIAYHANSSASQGCGTTRTTRAQKVSWNADGTPNLGTPVRAGVAVPVPSGE
jgi:GH43 family beta-xylosidase